MSRIAVVGDSWASLCSVALAVVNGESVSWITGTGSSLLPPTLSFPVVSEGGRLEGQILKKFFRACLLDLGDPELGDFTVEYRNKAFREPTTSRELQFVGVERNLLSSPELRFGGMSAFALERHLRKFVGGQVDRLEGDPVQALRVEGDRVVAVVLGSGRVLSVDRVIYGAAWGDLPSIEGVPKPVPLLRKRESVGAFQVLFTHKPGSAGVDSTQNYLIPVVPKVAGGGGSSKSKSKELELERQAVGFLIPQPDPQPSLSLWTVSLSAEELEDNHEISKKFKKLKQNLDRAFEGSDLFGGQFSGSLIGEQVRFVEEACFKDQNALDRPMGIDGLGGVEFVTDGYGLAASVLQVSRLEGFSFLDKTNESQHHPLLQDCQPCEEPSQQLSVLSP